MSKETRTVVVGSVQTKSGERKDGKGKWRRYALLDDQDRFVGSTFSGTVGKFLQDHEGDRVEVDVDEKEGSEGGKLVDLLDAREPSQGAPESQITTPAALSPQASPQAVRAAAVAAAAQFVTVGTPVDDLLTVADRLASWILSGNATEPAKD